MSSTTKTTILSKRIVASMTDDENKTLSEYFVNGAYFNRDTDKDVADFMFGNPTEPVPKRYVEALQSAAQPPSDVNKVVSVDYFCYARSKPIAEQVVRDKLAREWGGLFVKSSSQGSSSSSSSNGGGDDYFCCVTNGAFAGLSNGLRLLVNEGDRVVYLRPSWFFYRTMVLCNGGAPVAVDVELNKDEGSMRFPLEKVLDECATAKVLLLNNPHNPTGMIFDESTMRALANGLSALAKRRGSPIFVIEDAAYHDITFDVAPIDVPNFAQMYPDTVLVYTWGKATLAPGQRIGFMATSPLMDVEHRDLIHRALSTSMLLDYAYPSALMQYALRDIDNIGAIDVRPLAARRDRLRIALTDIGYQVLPCQATFYFLVLTPDGNGQRLADALFDRGVYVLSGNLFEMPQCIRLCLTANDIMVDKSLPIFEYVFKQLYK